MADTGAQVSTELDASTRRNFLRDEYLFLQGQYEDYDRRSLTIKGWASSGATVALALAPRGADDFASYFVPVTVAIIVGAIWYLEAEWKLFQYALADRIRIIEADFRNDPDILEKHPAPFQIYNWWYRSYSADEPIYPYEKNRKRPHAARLYEAAVQKFVCLPYVLILGLCIALIAIRICQAVGAQAIARRVLGL